MDQLDDLDRRIKKLDAMIVTLCRTNETCRRLAKLPGVGPIVATAIIGAVNDGRQFRSGREMAAWIGLVPRQYTTGGKPRLGGNRTTRQPLSQAPADPWRTRRRQPVGQA